MRLPDDLGKGKPQQCWGTALRGETHQSIGWRVLSSQGMEEASEGLIKRLTLKASKGGWGQGGLQGQRGDVWQYLSAE